MKLADILIKPVISEKSNSLSEKRNIYSFRVDKKANKIEIKKAVEDFYGVDVVDVRTVVVPSKSKSRFTKAGVISGRKPGYKKAYVTLAESDTIDIYSSL